MTDSTSGVMPATLRPAIGLIFRSLVRADFTVLLRNVRTLILNIALPILILVLTNLNGTTTSKIGFGGAIFDIALALTYGLMSSSLIGYSLTVARDRDAGVFQRLRITPAPTWAIMGSRLLVQIILDLIMTAVVVILGAVIHHLTLSVGDVLLFFGVSLVGGAMFLAIAQAIVGLVRTAAVVNALGRILYVVFLLLGLLGWGGLLGATVKAVSDWSPVGALINLYVGILHIAHWTWSDTTGVISTAAYIAIGTFVGIRWFRWDAR